MGKSKHSKNSRFIREGKQAYKANNKYTNSLARQLVREKRSIDKLQEEMNQFEMDGIRKLVKDAGMKIDDNIINSKLFKYSILQFNLKQQIKKYEIELSNKDTKYDIDALKCSVKFCNERFEDLGTVTNLDYLFNIPPCVVVNKVEINPDNTKKVYDKFISIVRENIKSEVKFEDFKITVEMMEHKDDISKLIIEKFFEFVLSPLFNDDKAFIINEYYSIFTTFNTSDVIVGVIEDNIKKSL